MGRRTESGSDGRAGDAGARDAADAVGADAARSALATRTKTEGTATGGRPHYCGQYMANDEIESILRIQWSATHPQDHGVRARLRLPVGVAAATIRPSSKSRFVRSICESSRLTKRRRAVRSLCARFVGLGKVPFGMIRSPKPLDVFTRAY